MSVTTTARPLAGENFSLNRSKVAVRRRSDGFAVLKLDGETGAEMWHGRAAGFVTGAASALVLTPYGTVVAVGALSNRFAIVELDAETGQEVQPSVVLGDGIARAVALDPSDGSTVAVGTFVTARTFFTDFQAAVVKVRNGAVVWSQGLTGTASSGPLSAPLLNSATSVAVADDGRIFGGGVLFNSGTNGDFSVVALNADGGEI